MSNSSILSFITVVQFAVIAIVHIALALGVYRDGESLQIKGLKTFLVTPVVWGLATLLGGIIPALAYWLIHHSTLKSTEILRADRDTLSDSESKKTEQGAAANP
jgi:hypothetical protein